jgi:hypothetical protein
MVNFIEQFDKKYRGPIINFVLEAIREGAETPKDIMFEIGQKFIRQKSYGDFPKYKQKFWDQFNEEEIYPFLHEWLDYSKLTRGKQKRVKQIKVNSKQMQKKLIKDIFNNQRPLSWSAISSWNYSKEDWAKKYIDGEAPKSSKEMDWGKKIGKLLETDPAYLPQVPRHSKMEHKFSVNLSGIPLVGYADSFCDKSHKKLLEFKTGKKVWDQKRADEHGQITMYCLMNYITSKIKPEDMDIALVWLPTQDNGDFSISFVEPIEDHIKIFKTKRTMTDIVKFASEIKRIYKEMELYCENRAKQNDILPK